ncbi:hypothetical protein QLX08_008443 [Tetragonisca angustula]|uniref:Uncharacterized protein n=1 Tax=Tetragonisca angustula TaxID=166442 RepID=A0AAW0ZN61_9HYME
MLVSKDVGGKGWKTGGGGGAIEWERICWCRDVGRSIHSDEDEKESDRGTCLGISTTPGERRTISAWLEETVVLRPRSRRRGRLLAEDSSHPRSGCRTSRGSSSGVRLSRLCRKSKTTWNSTQGDDDRCAFEGNVRKSCE